MAIPTNVTDQFYGAADDAIAGYATQIEVGDGASPEVFEAIAVVTRIQPGAQTSTDVKTGHLRSPGRHEEHRSGMRDTAPMTIEGSYVPTTKSHSTAGGGTGAFTAGGLPYLAAQGTNHSFRVKFPGGQVYSMRGYIATFGIGEVTKDNVVTYTCTVQPTEAPVMP